MSAIDHLKNVYDVKLKPRLLRSLIKEHFPDVNQSTGIPAVLSHIVYFVRTHELLSESVNESTEKKVVENWKLAVDEWVDGVISLVSSSMPDKYWTGICLLGVTCQVCNFDRFLASYSVWFNRLYSHIQQPSESQFVKVASCKSLSDLFTRLNGLPNAKKDGNSLAGKLIQPLLKLLNEDSSEAVWEGAVLLFCTILNSFPASVRPYLDITEAAITSKLLSGKCSVNMMKKLAYCIALLPKSKGDEESWRLMMQKILILINVHLNDVFQGLEEENKGTEAIRELVPPGKDPPPPLGGHTLFGVTVGDSTKRPEQLTMSSISMLILCCCTMLTNLSPNRVAVPIRQLLALVHRVMMVDGSIPRSMLPFMTAMQQQFVCLELPVLHLYSLELLTAIVESIRSQLLPHSAYILRLLKLYFKRCALPELRIKLYAITKSLLLFMGVGVALNLAQEVVDNACIDLNPGADENGCTASCPNSKASLAPMQSSHRKRKHGATAGSSEGQHEITGSGMEALKNLLVSPVSLKIAALEALETLLTVGGGSGSESWRPTVDLLLFTVAMNCCKEGWGNEEKSTSFPDDPIVTFADLQLAALRALHTSLLSSAHVRPLYLGRALELFGKGKQQAGRQLAGFCASALLALEVLIHPRFLPLERFPTATYNSDKLTHGFPETLSSGGHKPTITYFSGTQGTEQGASDSFHDDFYDKWFSDGNPSEIPVHKPRKDVEKLFIAAASGTKVLDRNNEEQADVGMRNRDEIMVESQEIQESIVKFQELPLKGVTNSIVTGDLQRPETACGELDSGLDDKNREKACDEDFLDDMHDGSAKMGRNAPTTSNADSSKTSVINLDDDSSMDSFPDIVEGDIDFDVEESG